jgi:AraC-like DNA-binding protein
MKIFIKNMVSNRCKIVVKEILRELDVHFILINLGEVEIMEDLTLEQREILNYKLLECGLEIMDDKKSILIEKIKSIIINLILHTEENIKVNFSCYLSEKLNHNYTYLANLFSDVQGITIEHFIINNKVEKIKELMIYSDLTITEIAYKMNYSSVAHLSTQFKKVTGLTPSHFKNLKQIRRSPIVESII